MKYENDVKTIDNFNSNAVELKENRPKFGGKCSFFLDSKQILIEIILIKYKMIIQTMYPNGPALSISEIKKIPHFVLLKDFSFVKFLNETFRMQEIK